MPRPSRKKTGHGSTSDPPEDLACQGKLPRSTTVAEDVELAPRSTTKRASVLNDLDGDDSTSRAAPSKADEVTSEKPTRKKRGAPDTINSENRRGAPRSSRKRAGDFNDFDGGNFEAVAIPDSPTETKSIKPSKKRKTTKTAGNATEPIEPADHPVETEKVFPGGDRVEVEPATSSKRGRKQSKKAEKHEVSLAESAKSEGKSKKSKKSDKPLDVGGESTLADDKDEEHVDAADDKPKRRGRPKKPKAVPEDDAQVTEPTELPKPTLDEKSAKKPSKTSKVKTPATKGLATEKTAANEPAIEKPAKKGQPAKKSAAKELAIDEPAIEEPAAKKSAAKKSAPKKSATKEPAIEEPTTNEPAIEEPAAKKSAAKKSATKKSTTKEPTIEEPTTNEPAIEESAAKKSAARKPATKKSATKEPPIEESAIKEPAIEEPATKEPATKEPATKKPVTKKPATKELATKEPATKEPATKEPATKEPAPAELATKKAAPKVSRRANKGETAEQNTDLNADLAPSAESKSSRGRKSIKPVNVAEASASGPKPQKSGKATESTKPNEAAQNVSENAGQAAVFAKETDVAAAEALERSGNDGTAPEASKSKKRKTPPGADPAAIREVLDPLSELASTKKKQRKGGLPKPLEAAKAKIEDLVAPLLDTATSGVHAAKDLATEIAGSVQTSILEDVTTVADGAIDANVDVQGTSKGLTEHASKEGKGKDNGKGKGKERVKALSKEPESAPAPAPAPTSAKEVELGPSEPNPESTSQIEDKNKTDPPIEPDEQTRELLAAVNDHRDIDSAVIHDDAPHTHVRRSYQSTLVEVTGTTTVCTTFVEGGGQS